ncbi:hypothetical protein R3P38DRAFT_2801287 [Favolaschia claudopus]|uniref:Uncharacterized protein n=1 Tax=Favolaschia claudopus TaxID=2862362 RepID=A0AAV9ZVT7_9AGAR
MGKECSSHAESFAALHNSERRQSGMEAPHLHTSMFVNCSDFTIQGNGLYLTSSAGSAKEDKDYRHIRVGDLHVLRFIREDDVFQTVAVQRHGSSVYRTRVLRGKRKTYHAKIVGSQDTFTVMACTDPDFAQWRSEVEENHQRTDSSGGCCLEAPNTSQPFVYISFRNYSMDIGWLNEPNSEWFRVSSGSLLVEPGDQVPWYKDLRSQDPQWLEYFQSVVPGHGCGDQEILRRLTIHDLLAMLPDRSDFRCISGIPQTLYLGAVYALDQTNGKLPQLVEKVAVFPTRTSIAHQDQYWIPRGAKSSLESCRLGHFTRISLRALHEIKLNEWETRPLFDWFLRVEDMETISAACYIQLSHILQSSHSKRNLSIENIALVTHLRLTMEMSKSNWNQEYLRPEDDIFLFVANPTAAHEHDVLSVNLSQIGFHWSLTPDGSMPLSRSEIEQLGLPEITVKTYLGTTTWREEDRQVMEDFGSILGADIATTGLSASLGYPLATIDGEISNLLNITSSTSIQKKLILLDIAHCYHGYFSELSHTFNTTNPPFCPDPVELDLESPVTNR